MSSSGLRRSATTLVAILVASALAGCQAHTYVVAGINESPNETYVRVRFDYGDVHVFELPPGAELLAFTALTGEFQGSVELLRTDCTVLGSWRDTSGGEVSVGPDGSVTFSRVATVVGVAAMQEIAACGNTQFRPAPSATGATP